MYPHLYVANLINNFERTENIFTPVSCAEFTVDALEHASVLAHAAIGIHLNSLLLLQLLLGRDELLLLLLLGHDLLLGHRLVRNHLVRLIWNDLFHLNWHNLVWCTETLLCRVWI